MKTLLLALGLVLCVVGARGHAFLAYPPSRSFISSWSYPGQPCSRAGVCHGDPHSSNNVRGQDPPSICGPTAAMGPSGSWFNLENTLTATTLNAGGTFTAKIEFRVGHWGRFQLRVCQFSGNEDSSKLTRACFDQNKLRIADGAQAGQDWYYVPASTTGILNPPQVFNVNYRLPSGLTCNGGTTKCVMHMLYQAGNDCHPEGTPPQYRHNPNLGMCAPGDFRTMENFWNCASFRVTGGGPGPIPPGPTPPTGCTSFAAAGGGCGTQNGNRCCPTGQWCSRFGWCGTTNDHRNQCQAQFSTGGSCSSSVTPPSRCAAGTAAPGGACGSNGGNRCCPTGQWCSRFGWCGTTPDHRNQCQAQFSASGSC